MNRSPISCVGERPGAKPISRLVAFAMRHPFLSIVAVALVSVLINCFPIVFQGRSFVSPAGALPMVYQTWPPLPGMAKTSTPVWGHGSDNAAALLWDVPLGFIESRSVLEYRELPLWNRYGHAGDTLIGQADSMLGDPLQWIVILGGGSAVAWDVKFLCGKFLFCVGWGLLILRLLGGLPLALIYTVLAAYCGAFFYINCHPAFFVFGYAPWILLSAMAWLEQSTPFRTGWGLIWLAANFACFNAGHVEAAVFLIGGLNLAAVVENLMRRRRTAREMAVVVMRMGFAILLLLGLTAPTWISFLASLPGSYSSHELTRTTQLPFPLLAGCFDDAFYLCCNPENNLAALAPGTSLLVLVGCVFSVLRWRRWKDNLFFRVNAGAILLWTGCIYGWIPSSVFLAIPLLNRVGHTHTDFAYLLVMHLTIQSAYGFKVLSDEKNWRHTLADCLYAALVFAGMIVMYCLAVSHTPLPWSNLLCAEACALGAPLLFVHLKNRPEGRNGFLCAGAVVLAFIPNFQFGLYAAGNVDWLMVPRPRICLDAPSDSIARVKSDNTAPFRTVGEGWNLYGDYSAVYGLEDIRSCAPLSNHDFINLVRSTAGIILKSNSWKIELWDPVAAHPLLNLLNVKYVLADPTVRNPDSGFRLTKRSDFSLLENLEAWPRAFFAERVLSISNNDEFVRCLEANANRPFAALTPVEIETQPRLRQLESVTNEIVSPATNYLLLPNSTAFDIHAGSAGIACLTEGQERDFFATANGEPKKVLTVNRAFKGIFLDRPGDYHIEFTYRPRHWTLACALFATSLLAIIVLVFVNVVPQNQKR